MMECPYDNLTLFERYERDQERKSRNWDDCEDDDKEDWEDEIYE